MKRLIALLIALMLFVPSVFAESLFKEEFDLYGLKWEMSMDEQRKATEKYLDYVGQDTSSSTPTICFEERVANYFENPVRVVCLTHPIFGLYKVLLFDDAKGTTYKERENEYDYIFLLLSYEFGVPVANIDDWPDEGMCWERMATWRLPSDGSYISFSAQANSDDDGYSMYIAFASKDFEMIQEIIEIENK